MLHFGSLRYLPNNGQIRRRYRVLVYDVLEKNFLLQKVTLFSLALF